MNQNNSCTDMGDEPNESNTYMNQSQKCIKSIHEPTLRDNSQPEQIKLILNN